MNSSDDRFQAAYDLLAAQLGGKFFHRLRDYVSSLDVERTTKRIAKNLRHDGEKIIKDYRKSDETTIRDLNRLRADLVAAAPEVDDSQITPKEPARHDWEYANSFANFDTNGQSGQTQLVERDSSGLLKDISRSSKLISIISAKLHELQWTATANQGTVTVSDTNLRPDLDDLGTELGNISRRHEHDFKAFVGRWQSDPGLALLELDSFIAKMNPPPVVISSADDRLAYINKLFVDALSGEQQFFDTVLNTDDVPAEQQEEYERKRAKLFGLVESVHKEIRVRLNEASVGSVRISAAAAITVSLAIGLAAGGVAAWFVPSAAWTADLYKGAVPIMLTLFIQMAYVQRLFSIGPFRAARWFTQILGAIFMLAAIASFAAAFILACICTQRLGNEPVSANHFIAGFTALACLSPLVSGLLGGADKR